jgi:hypothetical protein
MQPKRFAFVTISNLLALWIAKGVCLLTNTNMALYLVALITFASNGVVEGHVL